MSDPLLLQITKEISDRLAVIREADGYHTDIGVTVVRGRLIPDPDECPIVMVALADGEISERIKGAEYQIEQVVEVIGCHIYTTRHPEDLALQMGQDIHRALEHRYNPITRRDDVIGYIEPAGADQVEYPEAAGKVVAVRVQYQFSFTRRHGDPVQQ